MGPLDPNWISVELSRLSADIAQWTPEIRESYDSLFAQDDQQVNDESRSDSEGSDPEGENLFV